MLSPPRLRLMFSIATLASAAVVSAAEQDAAHGNWPFYPPVQTTVPSVEHHRSNRNPIDAFIRHKLEQHGLRAAPEADRVTLLRRLSFDLIGLPPSSFELETFLNDASPTAYERQVDRLLSSPQFGPRWAQHWLDVVRYAETEGFKADSLRPNAFRYRDYVIRAFNEDLGYDQFVREQLAGDELKPDNPAALIATGLNRLYPDENNAANLFQRRQEILDDITETTGLAFLGLTMGCAQCHDHKFDQIHQTDYYRLQAFFAPMVERDDVLAATPEERARHSSQQAVWDAATRKIRARMDALLAEERQKSDSYSLTKFRSEIQECVQKPETERTPLEEQIARVAIKQLNWRFKPDAAVKKLPQAERDAYTKLKQQLRAFDHLKPGPLPLAMAVSDVSIHSPPTHLLSGGNWKNPLDEVQPGFPVLLARHEPEVSLGHLSEATTGRRSALATWLTNGQHPLTARVIVNRLWHHHFGRGIVGTPNDFGVQGDPPTHAELLDWLAVELVSHNWSLKHIHRLMVTSATYRQDSSVDPDKPLHARALKTDGDNRLLWHARRRRLDGESIRDAILAVSGELNLRLFGSSAQPPLPEGISKRYAWQADKSSADRNRRSIFVLAKRNMRFPMFDAFDLPDLHNSCGQRTTTTTPQQALLMLNSEQSLEPAARWAARLLQHHGTDSESLIIDAWLSGLARRPDESELSDALRFLAIRNTEDEQAPANTVTDLCHGLFNCNEFIYID